MQPDTLTALVVLIFLFLGVFDSRPADYVFMLLFNWICVLVSFDWYHRNRFRESLHQHLISLFCSSPLIRAQLLSASLCITPLLPLLYFFLSLQHCAMSGWLCASGPLLANPCRAEKPNLGHMKHQQHSPAHISLLCHLSQGFSSYCQTLIFQTSVI